MSSQPLSSETRGGVLFITLDTPACAVNIFSPQLATQLLGILGDLDASIRAVVIRSAKPDSFINGAGLMLASSVSRPEDVPRLTSTIRQAYEAFGDLKIPTIAAIRGNCYGCGVEFVLHARYRVAADGYDTHFYMTEIADYLFVPPFGATQRLPRLLGLENASDFLLWGSRWSAREAMSRGLVDACTPDAELDAVVERMAVDLARDGTSPQLPRDRVQPATHPELHERRTRERIQRLPHAYQEVYTTCFDLMTQAARKEAAGPDDYMAEVLASGRSVMASLSKSAITHFFVHQTSELVCLRDAEAPPSFLLHCDEALGPRMLREELEARRIRGVTFESTATASPDALRVVAYAATRRSVPAPGVLIPASGDRVAMLEVLATGTPTWNTDVVLYAPAWGHGIAFVEIACSGPLDLARIVYRLLLKGGVTSIVTRPRRSFVTDEILRAYLEPQLAFLASGGAPSDLAATLLEFGFTRLARDWLAGWDPHALVTLFIGDGGTEEARRTCREGLAALPRTTDAAGGSPRGPLESAVLVSLLEVALRSLKSGTVSHPSLVDVAVRELLDFPIGRATLCRHMTVARAREILLERAQMSSWVSSNTLDSLVEYAEHGRDFYR